MTHLLSDNRHNVNIKDAPDALPTWKSTDLIQNVKGSNQDNMKHENHFTEIFSFEI